MTSDEFVYWMRGFGAAASDDMTWWQAWDTITPKLNAIVTAPLVSHTSDVVDTDNNWLTPNRPPGARVLKEEDK